MNVRQNDKSNLANASVAFKVSIASGSKYLDQDEFQVLANWFLMCGLIAQQNGFFRISCTRSIGQ
jgi:hypothetical protein